MRRDAGPWPLRVSPGVGALLACLLAGGAARGAPRSSVSVTLEAGAPCVTAQSLRTRLAEAGLAVTRSGAVLDVDVSVGPPGLRLRARHRDDGRLFVRRVPASAADCAGVERVLAALITEWARSKPLAFKRPATPPPDAGAPEQPAEAPDAIVVVESPEAPQGSTGAAPAATEAGAPSPAREPAPPLAPGAPALRTATASRGGSEQPGRDPAEARAAARTSASPARTSAAPPGTSAGSERTGVAAPPEAPRVAGPAPEAVVAGAAGVASGREAAGSGATAGAVVNGASPPERTVAARAGAAETGAPSGPDLAPPPFTPTIVTAPLAARPSWEVRLSVAGGVTGTRASALAPVGVALFDLGWGAPGLSVDGALEGSVTTAAAPGQISLSGQWVTAAFRWRFPVVARVDVDVGAGLNASRVGATASGFTTNASAELFTAGPAATATVWVRVGGPFLLVFRGLGTFRWPEDQLTVAGGPTVTLSSWQLAGFGGVTLAWP